MPDDFMMIRGRRYPIKDSWIEIESSDGRKRWGVVTEGEEHPSLEELIVSVTKPVTAGHLVVDEKEYTLINGRWEPTGPAEEQPPKAEATAPNACKTGEGS